jgi:Family of unknown function (DUF5372)
VVTYPFHPLVGQIVTVTGDHEHDGVHYRLIRQPHGGSFQIPEWMFDPGAGSFIIVAFPRFPANQLVELRALVDHLVACPPAKESPGGIGNEQAVSANGSVRTGPTSGSERRRTPEGGGAPRALLTEATTKPTGQQSTNGKKEAGNE